tara:strand:- start:384 stop:1121 length:738 start_codon:yes stop_codon:yes gene_type:complete
MPSRLTTELFIKRANKKHNSFYNYSLIEYQHANTKVKIICPKHGEFEQQPNNHLYGQGCIKCMGDRVSKSRKCNTEEFILKSKEIHGNRYDYSLVEYKKGKDKVIIICDTHGEFLQTPFAHSSKSMKQGCPFCKISKGEDEIEKFLIKNKIEYVREKRFGDCINPKTNKELPFDFYLPTHNLIIEYHGEQHYKEVPFFEKAGGGFEGRKYRDTIKEKFALAKEMSYLVISYRHYKEINIILNKQL